MSNSEQIIKTVKTYYGSTLTSTADLKTNACCTANALPPYLRALRKNIHEEVRNKYYGCGSPIPLNLQGATILDLGCGTGVDCYLAAQLVGEQGRVIGVDMTSSQIEVAQSYREHHREAFGYQSANTEFHHGYIEDLANLGIADNSVDVVISNCVINLSPKKEQVFSEIFRVLKPGGELYFADVFSLQRVPADLRQDPILLGECLGGAMYLEDFRRMLLKLGINDYRIVKDNPIDLKDPDVQARAGMIDFHSLTIRTFKTDFEDICENYGHVAFYNGTIPEAPHEFRLDDHHLFKTGLPVPVCGNTAKMLSESRYKTHFDVIGDFSKHYGAFPCGPDTVSAVKDTSTTGSCC